MSSASGIHHRTFSRYSSQADSGPSEEDRERERARPEGLPVDMAVHCFPTHAQRHAVPRSNQLRGVFLHPPPGYWDNMPAARYHRVAEKLLLRLHKPRSPSRVTQSLRRPGLAQNLLLMSLPEKYYY